MSYGVHKETPVHGTMWKNLSCVTFQKGQGKVKVKTKRYCAQLHYPSQLLKL